MAQNRFDSLALLNIEYDLLNDIYRNNILDNILKLNFKKAK